MRVLSAVAISVSSGRDSSESGTRYPNGRTSGCQRRVGSRLTGTRVLSTVPHVRSIRTILATLACLGALGAAPGAAAPPPIRHVFVIVLENKGFSETFGAGSQAPYLSRTLTAQGQLLANYYAVAHLSLPNYIAMVSGQAANPVTQSDCQFYMDVVPGSIGADGQAVGQGCVYPSPVKTVADQLRAKGFTWRGYSQDKTQSAKVGDQYAARHNPFVYFHSIIDDATSCNANVVALDRLPADLAS